MTAAKNQKPILIAADHAGVDLKKELKFLVETVHWEDLGPLSPEPSVDYPDFAKALCEKIIAGEADLGVLICGSGIGMSIAANRYPGIRAALCENPVSARLAREHNHANVLCLASRFIAPHYAREILNAFLAAKPSTDDRHLKRIKKL